MDLDSLMGVRTRGGGRGRIPKNCGWRGFRGVDRFLLSVFTALIVGMEAPNTLHYSFVKLELN